MAEEQWAAVESYVDDLFVGKDRIQEEVLRVCEAEGLPAIHVSPSQGKFLFLLATAIGARSILEIGTLGAYSTIWLARALPPDGRLVTLESDAKHAAVARRNIDLAGLSAVVQLKLGVALEHLDEMHHAGTPPFDLIFIDADKVSYPDYLTSSTKLSRKGTLIIADNVIRGGAVVDSKNPDPSVQGVRQFNEQLTADGRLSATAIQTVGSKGYDGFTMAVVTEEVR